MLIEWKSTNGRWGAVVDLTGAEILDRSPAWLVRGEAKKLAADTVVIGAGSNLYVLGGDLETPSPEGVILRVDLQSHNYVTLAAVKPGDWVVIYGYRRRSSEWAVVEEDTLRLARGVEQALLRTARRRAQIERAWESNRGDFRFGQAEISGRTFYRVRVLDRVEGKIETNSPDELIRLAEGVAPLPDWRIVY